MGALSVFSRKEKVVAPPPAPVQRDGRSLELDSVRRHLGAIRKADIESTSAPSSWQAARDQIFGQYDELVKLICRVDTKRLSAEDRTQLISVIYEQTPSAAEKVSEEAIRHWHLMNTANTSYTSEARQEIRSATETVREILRLQRNPTYQSAPMEEDVNAELLALEFPGRSFSNAEITAALTALEQAWNIARQRNLSAEESYTVQAIATSYLPETWQAMKGYETFPEASRERVEQHVLEQLGLLNEQLEHILTRNVEVSLGVLEAQTYFLREKSKRAKSPRLKLSGRRGD